MYRYSRIKSFHTCPEDTRRNLEVFNFGCSTHHFINKEEVADYTKSNYYPKLEWQNFRNTENTEKLRKLSTKRKTRLITENSIFATLLLTSFTS